MGWLDESQLPRMVAVQSDKCAPIVDKFNKHTSTGNYEMSIANGLSVPKAFGEDMILRVLHESGGTAITVTDHQILAGAAEISGAAGMLVSPEGAAVWEALKILVDQGWIHREETVLLLNTGSGYKYLANYS